MAEFMMEYLVVQYEIADIFTIVFAATGCEEP
jgi:hypothetical protein